MTERRRGRRQWHSLSWARKEERHPETGGRGGGDDGAAGDAGVQPMEIAAVGRDWKPTKYHRGVKLTHNMDIK